jgi:hypothetical protein
VVVAIITSTSKANQGIGWCFLARFQTNALTVPKMTAGSHTDRGWSSYVFRRRKTTGMSTISVGSGRATRFVLPVLKSNMILCASDAVTMPSFMGISSRVLACANQVLALLLPLSPWRPPQVIAGVRNPS